eukprot:s386_g55.t1
MTRTGMLVSQDFLLWLAECLTRLLPAAAQEKKWENAREALLLTASCLPSFEDRESLSRWSEILFLAWHHHVFHQFPSSLRLENDICHLSISVPDFERDLPQMGPSCSWDLGAAAQDLSILRAECCRYTGRMMDDMARSIHLLEVLALELSK